MRYTSIIWPYNRKTIQNIGKAVTLFFNFLFSTRPILGTLYCRVNSYRKKIMACKIMSQISQIDTQIRVSHRPIFPFFCGGQKCKSMSGRGGLGNLSLMTYITSGNTAFYRALRRVWMKLGPRWNRSDLNTKCV